MKSPITDIHTHVLPGMDDGSDSIQTSILMLKQMSDMGITTVCGTSHYYRQDNSIESFAARREESYKKLCAAANDEPGLPKIIPASETAYFTGISEIESEEILKLCISGTKTLLLEMPFCEWSDFHINEIQSLIYDQGLKLVIVHPERFCFSKSNKERLKALAALPIALQVNAGSLTDILRRRQAFEILELTDTPLIGSDCHNMDKRRPNYEAGRKAVCRRLGESFAEHIEDNAYMLISS